MNILGAAMKGLVLTSTASPLNRTVDFVLTSGDDVIVACMNWWRADWSANLLFLVGKLVEDHYGWTLTRADGIGIHFTKPESTHDAVEIDHGRLDQDINRPAYMGSLSALLDLLEEKHRPALEEWIDAFRSRPLVDPVEFHRERTEKYRNIGTVTLEDEDGKVVDVLVIDDLGAAAVANGNSWLESLGSQWMTNPDRPSMLEFLDWIRQQRPYGGVSIGSVKSGSSEGSAEAIALRSLTPTF